jgi:hypothetical protein
MENDIDSLIADFTCDDVMKCQIARRKLVNMGGAAVEALVKELSNKRHWVRWEAAKALGQIGDKASAEALVKALEDKEFDVRWLAAEALINIGRDSLGPLLALRRGAHHVLHDMHREDLDTILQPVMTALEDMAPSIEVLQLAERALEVVRKG